jgi:hypothetical protein
MEAELDCTSRLLTDVKTVISILAVLAAAVVAVIKFRVYNVLSPRYRSELVCNHYVLPDSKVLFVADCTIHNTGDLPIDFDSVTLQLRAEIPRPLTPKCKPKDKDDTLIGADEDQFVIERVIDTTDNVRRELLHIEAGERSIFPLRCKLAELPQVVFVHCVLSWKQSWLEDWLGDWWKTREPAPYRGIYVRNHPGRLGDKGAV